VLLSAVVMLLELLYVYNKLNLLNKTFFHYLDARVPTHVVHRALIVNNLFFRLHEITPITTNYVNFEHNTQIIHFAKLNSQS